MVSQREAFPFRWVLPTAQLIICFVTVWPLWYVAGSELLTSLRHSNHPVRESSTIMALNLPEQETPQQQFEHKLLEVRLHVPIALNIPVKFIQLPYVVLSRNKIEWTPRCVRWIPHILQFPDIWKAMTWPIVGVVFWWMSPKYRVVTPQKDRKTANQLD